MQSLPDELLLEIFGRITDAETLLDGVALVCRRWNALARCDLRLVSSSEGGGGSGDHLIVSASYWSLPAGNPRPGPAWSWWCRAR